MNLITRYFVVLGATKTRDDCNGTKGPVQDLVTVTNVPCVGELGFTPSQESGHIQSLLRAVSWSGRFDDPLVVLGLVSLVIVETSARFGVECLCTSRELAVGASRCPVDGESWHGSDRDPPVSHLRHGFLSLDQLKESKGAGNH